MKEKVRWGILGCGKIANKFAADLKLVADAELTAVASKDKAKGEAFQKQFAAPLFYNSYEALAASSEVDVIYVATPHGYHHEHTMLCLIHKKAVLCEKAFGLNYKQVSEMVSLARKEKVFLMEAFWTKFLPQYEKVISIIKSGDIGTVKLIQADFGFRAPEPLPQRLFDPLLGGGALLDIGIYPVFLVQSILGKPKEVHAMITAYSTGVDEQCVITMKFDGALAVLSSTFASDTPVEAMIAGSKGRIQMRNRFHNAIGRVELVYGKDEVTSVDVHKEEGYGYQFEARHVNDCIKKGLTESPVMSLQDSLDLIETLDRIRVAGGIKYHCD
ncbi:Gfo/Idh/MocA family protein [Chryseosolibacter indicus]|uniref:Gfo/Idh/MocA family oxidoreductase n=1 Tax=Chryseosolibacter indicus TaxID=2782351 RepID=A0ABS5VYB0_9BACT|nr:Gfo/Idh/MocA family oxidoreductase [Chryseosolibacter indicus]MBT1706404.1 Gfo/Idh/MocA family oxidoreductase [Chryseosolibacter indicus]